MLKLVFHTLLKLLCRAERAEKGQDLPSEGSTCRSSACRMLRQARPGCCSWCSLPKLWRKFGNPRCLEQKFIFSIAAPVEQGSGVNRAHLCSPLSRTSIPKQTLTDTPFLLTWEWYNRALQPQGMEAKTPQPFQ